MTTEPLALSRPDVVEKEISAILEMMGCPEVAQDVRTAMRDVARLYGGQWQGYYACDTPYHNLEHVMLVTIAMGRLVHGAWADGFTISSKDTLFCFVAALFHDAGLIRHVTDSENHGAQLTALHVVRSAELAEGWLAGRGATRAERDFVKALLLCTELETFTSAISFDSEPHRYLGSLLKAADLAGQLADLEYAAKLPLLAEEMAIFRGRAFEGEAALVSGTPGFCRRVLDSLVVCDGKNLLAHSRSHFRLRFHIDADLHTEQIKRQQTLLEALTRDGLSGY